MRRHCCHPLCVKGIADDGSLRLRLRMTGLPAQESVPKYALIRERCASRYGFSIISWLTYDVELAALPGSDAAVGIDMERVRTELALVQAIS